MNSSIDISDVILNTERLTLRPFKLDDLDDFYEYAKVDGVGERAGWVHHDSRETSLKILNMFIEDKKTFAIVFNHKVIGSIGVETYNEEQFKEFEQFKGRELGFVLAKDFWGVGLMKEACDEVIKYLFDVVKLDFLLCAYFVENKQSARVQEKLGFKEYKRDFHDTRLGMKQSVFTILYHD